MFLVSQFLNALVFIWIILCLKFMKDLDIDNFQVKQECKLADVEKVKKIISLLFHLLLYQLILVIIILAR